MKPFHILSFFLSVVILLFILAALFPADGIRINDQTRLRFFSLDELFETDTFQYADISEIIDNHIPLTKSEIFFDEVELTDAVTDTLSIAMDTIRANPDSLKKITHLIEFSQEGKERFHDFFNRISVLPESRELIRILHYGDSQIETDRITGYVRNRLQKKFGGSGCGLVPAVPLYNGKMSVRQDYSRGWQRKTGFIDKDTSILHNRYGALLSITRLEKTDKTPGGIEWLEFEPSSIAYRTARSFSDVSLFLGQDSLDNLEVSLYKEDSLWDVAELEKPGKYEQLSFRFDETPNQIRFEFSPSSDVLIYGVSLDNEWGLAMDNIPLRGSAGLVFSKTDTSFLKNMYEDMNVGMLLLQFGGNVVPYMKNAKRYESFFKRELNVLRSVLPDAPILVIGPSDMSVREKGVYETFPNLENVRDALKNAALESGYAFWDMYEAMGGRNSMPSWVFAEPSLAISDFVHFNSRGARIIAEMLFNSIMFEYNSWLSGN